MKEVRLISIEGPIGSGKTSLSKSLAERLNADLILEKVEENPFLTDFYKSKKKYGFQTQVFFLLSRYKQQMELYQQNLFRQTTIIDYLFDKDKIFAYINLSEDEIRLYEEIYSLLKSKIPTPDLVIYLQADIETLKKRIRKRGRVFEKNVTDEYLEEVSRAFNCYFFHFFDAPLLIVNTNEINFVDGDGDIDHLIRKIMSHRIGVEYYSPLAT